MALIDSTTLYRDSTWLNLIVLDSTMLNLDLLDSTRLYNGSTSYYLILLDSAITQLGLT